MSATNCTSCPDGFDLDEETNTCVNLGSPSICSPGCLDCENDLYCNVCATGFFRHVFEDDNGDRAVCVRKCPAGTSPGKNDNDCVNCTVSNCT
jgi:hypothetical protein